MRLKFTFLLIPFFILNLFAQGETESKIKTRWAENITEKNVWKEYPRPQLEREEWMNLNGLWDYAIVKKDAALPKSFDGKILVPFCVESSLSRVQKKVLPEDQVWYSRTFVLPEDWDGKNILLHFDAVDWKTKVWLNGKEVGSHEGGSDPFTFNITPFLQRNSEQELNVSVWDPTDTGMQPRGKQVLEPKGIWYTAVTGIWQTVWLEPVEKTYIKAINPVADIDNDKVTIKNEVEAGTENTKLQIKVIRDGKVIANKTATANKEIEIDIPNPKLWSPEDPFLYQLKVSLEEDGTSIDEVQSYFAMRKISKEKDELGYERLFLNNEPRFQFGTLDQGWWPGGLLTPPSDEAMRYDMDMLKKMGFNMLRKHIKVEPSRYYYYADKIGLLIWQDMVAGFETAKNATQHVKPMAGEDWIRPDASAKDYEREWKSIIDHLKFFPSIVTWVSFNEGWGQYDTERIVKWTQKYDPTRLVDGVSGWTDRGVGDMNDAHHYPGPGMEPAAQNPGRIIVLGEFGGLGLPIKDHLWNPKMRNWGYRTYDSGKRLKKQYAELIHNMAPMVNQGLSAAIYTQTTDVEGEVNGLITYDREKVKMDVSDLKEINELMFHKPVKTMDILPDSEVAPQKMFVSNERPDDLDSKFKKGSKTISGTVKIEKGENAWLMKEFKLNDVPENLQIRLYGVGDIKIYLNGKPVIDEFLRTKRHYDEINLSDYISVLKEGDNTIVMEIIDLKKDAEFDFGMYAY